MSIKNLADSVKITPDELAELVRSGELNRDNLTAFIRSIEAEIRNFVNKADPKRVRTLQEARDSWSEFLRNLTGDPEVDAEIVRQMNLGAVRQAERLNVPFDVVEPFELLGKKNNKSAKSFSQTIEERVNQRAKERLQEDYVDKYAGEESIDDRLLETAPALAVAQQLIGSRPISGWQPPNDYRMVEHDGSLPIRPALLFESSRRYNPDVWDAIGRRLYKGVDAYEDPRFFTAYGASSINWLMSRGRPVLESEWPSKDGMLERGVMTAAIAEHDVPMFFVAPDMLDAADKTEAPDTIDWARMKLPHEGAVFIMPRGKLISPRGGAINFIAYARLEGKRDYKVPGHPGARLRTDFDHFMMSATDTVRMFDYNRVFKAMYDRRKKPKVGDKETLIAQLSAVPDEQGEAVDKFYTQADLDFNDRCSNILFNLLLLMENKPEIISREGSRRVGYHKKQRCDLWSPNILGAKYRIERVGLDQASERGSHASPRWHWRSGHWREQGYGPLSCVDCGCNHAAHDREDKRCRRNEHLSVQCSGRYRHERYERQWVKPMLVNYKEEADDGKKKAA